jgi:hypothetical protein
VTEQVLHLDLISLAPDVTADAREALIAAAAELVSIPDVLRIGVIEAGPGAEYDIALYFVLQGFGALEPFGTNERYVRFLQGSAAPLLRGLAGADVRLEDDFPLEAAPHAACLCLAAPFQTYDWEVSAALQTWRDGLDRTASVIGLSIGERGRYRGLAIAFAQTPVPAEAEIRAPFGKTLITGSARTLS